MKDDELTRSFAIAAMIISIPALIVVANIFCTIYFGSK